MALLSELIDIPLSIQRDDFVLKLDEGIRDDTATKTLSDYVITPELAPKFDEALRFLEAAVTTGTSKATFLHGSFGAGKSHFMAILHLILQGAPAARGHAKLTHIMPKHAGWLANRKFLLIPYHMIGKRDVTSAILGTYVEHVRKHHPEAAIPGVYCLQDARATFPHADGVRTESGETPTVFNVGGNKYRLIARIRYDYRLVNVRLVLTHAEYDRNTWKE